MAQFIGGVVIAVIVFALSVVQFTVFNHLTSLGCLILGIVAWRSLDTMIGGILITIGAVWVLDTGAYTLPDHCVRVGLIALIAAVWSFVHWGLK